MKPGERVGVWVVEEQLGRGGMGSVYRCHNADAPRILAAVKLLDASFDMDEDIRARFVREAELLATLEHVNIVKVRNVRLDQRPPYLEMEFVSGTDLTTLIRRGPLSLHETVAIGLQLASAIRYLHTRGVAHRDIKPANVLVRDDGQVKLVDFGLAYEGGTEQLTQPKTTFGTASYAPPEWLQPELLSPRDWDVYGLGVVLYELLTGGTAFPMSRGLGPKQQALQVMTEKQKVACLDPGAPTPTELRELVKSMTRRELDRRLTDIDAVISHLLAVDVPQVTNAPPTAPSVTHDFERPRSAGGAGWLTLSLASMAVMAVVVAVVITWAVATQRWSAAFPPAPSQRPLLLSVAGPATTDDLVVRHAGEPGARDGLQVRFPSVPVGGTELTWAVGPGCDLCPSTCPTWCATGASSLSVPPGTEPFPARLDIPAPTPHPVEVSVEVTGVKGTPPAVRVRLGGVEGELDGTVARFPAVQPGQHQIETIAGTCSGAQAGCTNSGACPPGCSSVLTRLVVPVAGDEAVTLEVSVPAPDPVPATPPPRVSTYLVTWRDVQAFLAAEPRWQREATIARGQATAGYLQNVQQGDGAATGLSWYASEALCARRGGLAAIDAPPLTWSQDDPSRPYHEWRIDGVRPVWRRADGATSDKDAPATANSFLGTRCLR